MVFEDGACGKKIINFINYTIEELVSGKWNSVALYRKRLKKTRAIPKPDNRFFLSILRLYNKSYQNNIQAHHEK